MQSSAATQRHLRLALGAPATILRRRRAVLERAITALERGAPRSRWITAPGAEPAGLAGRRRTLMSSVPRRTLVAATLRSRPVRALLAARAFRSRQTHERIAALRPVPCRRRRASPVARAACRDAAWPERLGLRINPYHWYVCAAEKALFKHPGLTRGDRNSRMSRRDPASLRVAPDKLACDLQRRGHGPFSRGRRRRVARRRAQRVGSNGREFALLFVGSGFARKVWIRHCGALAAADRRPRCA